MSVVESVLGLLGLASAFIVPQLLGILLYFRLKCAPRWVAAIVAALAPAVIFFFVFRLILLADLREAYARGDNNGCGMPVLGAVVLLFAGTVVHLVLGLVTQLTVAATRRPKYNDTLK